MFVGDTSQSLVLKEIKILRDIDPTPVSFPKDGSEIIFDLETTGLGKKPFHLIDNQESIVSLRFVFLYCL